MEKILLSENSPDLSNGQVYTDSGDAGTRDIYLVIYLIMI